MRGKRNPTYEDFGEDRITPADAGKTDTLGLPERNGAGSPPRMRGKPRCDIQKGEKTGITPADAGKTLTA